MEHELDEAEDEDEGAQAHEVIDVDNYSDGTAAKDPLWPKKTVLTHPLAIDCLLQFLNSKHLYNIVTRNMNCYSTSMVESFNSLIIVYAPKRKHFGARGMKARVGMAVLDWNENVGRLSHVTKNGRRYTKHREKTYKWQAEALNQAFGVMLW